ncbi:MAG: pteridine reductase, partial [Rhodanobacteraceae bacterium]
AELNALIAELEATRAGSTLALQVDLRDVETLAGLVASAGDRFGRLDALINNASAFYPTPLATATPEQWDELFSANVRAPFFLAQAAAPRLAECSGAIVNIADLYAEHPLPQHSIYCMSKAALAMMTKSLARDLGPDVRVNAIAPGAVLWPDSGKASAEREAIIERTPLKRMGTPEDVASTVLWLLRDATFVTGEMIRVDGGRHLGM